MNAQDIFENLKIDFIQNKIPIPNDLIDPTLHYSRSTSALGRCKQEKGKYIIYLSRYAMKNDEQIRATLAHELVHTIKGCMNHGQKFHDYGDMVYKKLGIQIESKATKEEAKLSGIEEARIQKARYYIQCEKCGYYFFRQKQSKLIIHPERYRCKCGGNLICKRIR